MSMHAVCLRLDCWDAGDLPGGQQLTQHATRPGSSGPGVCAAPCQGFGPSCLDHPTGMLRQQGRLVCLAHSSVTQRCVSPPDASWALRPEAASYLLDKELMAEFSLGAAEPSYRYVAGPEPTCLGRAGQAHHTSYTLRWRCIAGNQGPVRASASPGQHGWERGCRGDQRRCPRQVAGPRQRGPGLLPPAGQPAGRHCSSPPGGLTSPSTTADADPARRVSKCDGCWTAALRSRTALASTYLKQLWLSQN